MRWSSFVINHKNFPFISRLQKFILSLFISSKNDLLSVCTCIHIYRYTRSSWENVNLDVCFYVLIAMPLQSQESLNRPVFVLEILNRFWTLLKILNRVWTLLKIAENSEQILNITQNSEQILSIAKNSEQILNITVKIFNRLKKIITWNLFQMIFFFNVINLYI